MTCGEKEKEKKKTKHADVRPQQRSCSATTGHLCMQMSCVDLISQTIKKPNILFPSSQPAFDRKCSIPSETSTMYLQGLSQPGWLVTSAWPFNFKQKTFQQQILPFIHERGKKEKKKRAKVSPVLVVVGCCSSLILILISVWIMRFSHPSKIQWDTDRVCRCWVRNLQVMNVNYRHHRISSMTPLYIVWERHRRVMMGGVMIHPLNRSPRVCSFVRQRESLVSLIPPCRDQIRCFFDWYPDAKKKRNWISPLSAIGESGRVVAIAVAVVVVVVGGRTASSANKKNWHSDLLDILKQKTK